MTNVIVQAALGAAAAALPLGCASGRAAVATSPEGLDSFAQLDATEQARLVRRREVSPRELAEAAIARIEALDGRLNAVVTRAFERGLTLADRPLPDGPFRGVPFLFKDLMDWEGVRTTFGSRLFAGNIASKTDEPARRMLAAGLVPLGKTNTPELGLLPTTQSQLLGPAHNPWNPAFDPGGSSGGAAVAVASGMVPMAGASDGGGSIRVPACNTGLFGFKPSRGRVPARSARPGRLSVAHCVSRSVRDSAALLEAIHITLDPHFTEASPEPLQMFLPQKRTTAIHAEHLVHGVSKEECAIQHGDAHLVERHFLTVPVGQRHIHVSGLRSFSATAPGRDDAKEARPLSECRAWECRQYLRDFAELT